MISVRERMISLKIYILSRGRNVSELEAKTWPSNDKLKICVVRKVEQERIKQ